MPSSYPIHCLNNGIRVVFQPTSSEVCHCGIVIGAGSRDELDDEYGIAHFIEHTIFKGTTKRTALQILNRLDEVGGELNAYTTKDETAVHAAFLSKDFERAAELMADMVFNPTFPEKELAKERDVISDEISSYRDTPSELIFDDFEERIFKMPALSHPILGNIESIRSFDGDKAKKFMQRTYRPDRMVLSIRGNISDSRIIKVAEKYFGHHMMNVSQYIPTTYENHKSERFEIRENKGYCQAHILLGNIAPSAYEAQRVPLYMLSYILGGPSMNASLSIALRERNGIGYNVSTEYTSFADTGLQTIYFGTDATNIEKSLCVIKKELLRLCNNKMNEKQLFRIKRQIAGQILMSEADSESLMLSAARSVIFYGEADNLSRTVKQIEDVSSDELLDIAQRVFNPSDMSLMIYW